MHFHYDYVDAVTHAKPDSASALIDPNRHLLILFAIIAIICLVLVKIKITQIKALFEIVLALLVAVGAYLHDVVEWTAEQVFT